MVTVGAHHTSLGCRVAAMAGTLSSTSDSETMDDVSSRKVLALLAKCLLSITGPS